MRWKTFAPLLTGVAAVLLGGVSLAVDCTVCTECSADPAFVQRDLRNPEMLLIVKRLASKRIHDEGLMAVVVVSDSEDGCCGQDILAPRTLVLIGSEGSVEAQQANAEIPPEVKSLVGLDEAVKDRSSR